MLIVYVMFVCVFILYKNCIPKCESSRTGLIALTNRIETVRIIENIRKGLHI